MASVLAKCGDQANVATYKHVCDTYEDMSKIDKHRINLGSTCLVLKGKSGKIERYMANSKKEWVLITNNGGGSDSSGDDEVPTDLERVTEEELEEMLNG